jgi:serine/threonine protein kinase
MGLVTAKEGLSLPQLLPPSQKTFSLSTVCLLAIDIIKIVETLHDKNAVLSDFTPSNFRIRADRIDKLVVSSLYYCRRYRSSRTLDHYKCKDAYHGDFINHFVSVHRLSSLLTSRRDDLQSYFLLVVYLLKGSLPWSDVPLDNLAKAEQQLFKKIRPVFTDATSKNKEKLHEGLPREFVDVFDHIISLKYEERPNYCFIRLKFQKILNKINKNI